jgi:formylmethanofuran dehydrogenase subunit D
VETTTADNGDLIITFSPTELEKLGWKEDDTINIIDNEDGTITLEKMKEE